MMQTSGCIPTTSSAKRLFSSQLVVRAFSSLPSKSTTMSGSTVFRILTAAIFGSVVFTFYHFEIHKHISLESLQNHRELLRAYVNEHYILAPILYMLAFVGMTSLEIVICCIVSTFEFDSDISSNCIFIVIAVSHAPAGAALWVRFDKITSIDYVFETSTSQINTTNGVLDYYKWISIP